MDTAGSQPAAAASFDQLDILAHVESDRFCDKCAYNLRGQPVRREPGTQLVLCRCPECATFHPAIDHATALRPWIHRLAVAGIVAWLCVVVWLLAASIGGQFLVMGVTLDELGRQEMYEPELYSYELRRGGDTDYLEQRRRDRMVMRVVAIGSSGVIGFASVCVWTVLFPHWRRDGYQMIAIVGPLIALLIIAVLLAIGDLRHVPHDGELLLLAMFAAHALLGIVASISGRPLARGILRILLPPRIRTFFSFVWTADGKKPPHAN